MPNSSIGLEQHCSLFPDIGMPPPLRNEMTELLTDVILSLVSSKLRKMVDPMRERSDKLLTRVGFSKDVLRLIRAM
jgi:hypothetical protein